MGFFSWFTGEPTINDLKIRIEECKRNIEAEKNNLAREDIKRLKGK